MLAVVVVLFHQEYVAFLDQYKLPSNLSFTIYRLIVVICLVEAVKLIVISTYKPQNNARRDNFTIGIAHLAKLTYVLMALVLVISLFNVTIKEAVTTLSFVAAAIVLMTKDYISNFINGMYLTFAKVINVGDTVEIGVNRGKILDITLTNVHLLNDDDDLIYIPNNKAFSNEIINYTRRQLKKSNVEFEVEVEYVPTVEWLEEELVNSLRELNELIQAGTCILKVQAVKHEYTSFKFQYILVDPLNKEQDKRVRKHIIRFVVKMLAQLRAQSNSECGVASKGL